MLKIKKVATSKLQNYLITGNVTRVITEDGYKYERIWLTVSGTDYVMFRVQACSNAVIALSHIPGVITSGTYQIIIGGSDNQVLRLCAKRL